MTGRPRTSTLVISGLFLAVLALYLLVRPVPTADTSAGASQSATTTSPVAPKPSPDRDLASPGKLAQPVAHAEPFTHADQQFPGAGRITEHGAARPQPVAVHRVAHPVTSGVTSAG